MVNELSVIAYSVYVKNYVYSICQSYVIGKCLQVCYITIY